MMSSEGSGARAASGGETQTFSGVSPHPQAGSEKMISGVASSDNIPKRTQENPDFFMMLTPSFLHDSEKK